MSVTVFNGIAARLRAAGCVYAEEEARLLLSASGSPEELDSMTEKRAAGFPLEHVMGYAEFCGFRIEVDPHVFVPRRRTEFLVNEAAAITRTGDTVLDLCCGSGAVGAVLAKLKPGIRLYAADIDSKAVTCAIRNVREADGVVFEGDLYEPLPKNLRGSVNVLVVNAPYVPTNAMSSLPSEARIHEDRIALDGGLDGHDVQRRSVIGAGSWLAPGGFLLMETSSGQSAETLRIFQEQGFLSKVAFSPDLEATVVIGTKVKAGSARLS
ncbi:putative protein N(5)-glutamine methyltransferase [Fictibacillus fluitans]|uniref:peptide chain release factor N(5)-glutamine methyltransferase n=1 Tax=Fictibacillus fluitans TaxID=3058422 RepID=A0ABT8HZ61_9BACL|nr:putative protein N(5)-glutamine methyltransferase [Fictibacillus sp. NE201]MDN4526065.1 putative protein N(5)-glutamine methyltransferase [Fictibacillus sp. NE201]